MFSQAIYSWFGTSNSYLDIAAMVLVLFQAIYLTWLTIEHRLGHEISLLVGVFYIILSSALPDFLHLSPLLMANTFFIIALGELFSTYQKKSVADRIFNVGFWLSIGSLFYFSYSVLLLFGIIGVSNLRAFHFRELLMNIIGFITPYLLLGTYFFWTDQLPTLWQYISENVAWASFQSTGVNDLVVLIFFALLLLFALFSRASLRLGALMQTQKKLGVVYWGLLIAPLTALVQRNVGLEHLLVLTPLLAIPLGLRLTMLPQRLAETFHFLLIVAILFWQLKPLWIPS